ncbi:CinA family protein, partial [Bathymodiolus thermophilus thioautotrophic gill symbiont]
MHQLTKLLTQKSLTIAVAESCTGGNLSALLTSKSGSSTYFDRGYITYSNHAKIDMLQVNPTTLDQFGAVSEPTALEMVQGVINNSTANIAVSITGIAGPTSDDT